MDKADPMFDCGQLGEAKEAACGMIVSSGNAPAVLETVEEAFDAIAGGIERLVH